MKTLRAEEQFCGTKKMASTFRSFAIYSSSELFPLSFFCWLLLFVMDRGSSWANILLESNSLFLRKWSLNNEQRTRATHSDIELNSGWPLAGKTQTWVLFSVAWGSFHFKLREPFMPGCGLNVESMSMLFFELNMKSLLKKPHYSKFWRNIVSKFQSWESSHESLWLFVIWFDGLLMRKNMLLEPMASDKQFCWHASWFNEWSKLIKVWPWSLDTCGKITNYNLFENHTPMMRTIYI